MLWQCRPKIITVILLKLNCSHLSLTFLGNLGRHWTETCMMRLRPKACAASTKTGRSLWNGIWGQMRVVSFWGTKGAFVVFSRTANRWAIVFISFFNHSYLCLYSYWFVWLQPLSLLCTPDCVYMWFSKNCLLHCILQMMNTTYKQLISFVN